MLVVLQWTLIGMWGAGLLFSGVFGRRCERLGVAICVVGTVATLVAQEISYSLLNNPYPTAAFSIVYLAESAAFAALAVKYPQKLWPGVAGCFQFLVFTFSVSQHTNFPLSDQQLVALSNLSALGVSLTLAVGSYLARWGKPRVDPWDDYAATLATLPPPSPLPPRADISPG